MYDTRLLEWAQLVSIYINVASYASPYTYAALIRILGLREACAQPRWRGSRRNEMTARSVHAEAMGVRAVQEVVYSGRFDAF